MRLDVLRMIVGFTIIISHLVTFAMIMLFGGRQMTLNERIDVTLLISPIFAVYVTAIVRHFMSNLMSSFDIRTVHPSAAALSVGTAIVFSVAVPATVVLFLSGVIDTVAALKSTTGVLETVLGLYTGAVIDTLFGRSENKSPARRSPRAR